MNKKILVVGAHPDDEILGVGGTILKHIEQKDQVYVLNLTRPNEKYSDKYKADKLKMQKDVDKLLGVTRRFQTNFITTTSNTIAFGDFNYKVFDVVLEVKPDIVYTHYPKDLSLDHLSAFNAVMVSCRPLGLRKPTIRVFETLSETEWGKNDFCPNYYVDISNFIEKKVQAFLIYESEVKEQPHPRSEHGIRSLASKRGSEIVVPYAEAFMTIRECWL